MAYDISALPHGSLVFVDSNIFIYGLLRESQQCAHFLERCHRQELRGATTLEVVGEVCHRLMLKEAFDAGAINRLNALALKRKRDAIRGLRKYWDLTARIFELNLALLPSDEPRHRGAQQARIKYGLLTNDSLVVAACFENGIDSLATRDADFDRIAGLTVYRPADVP
jgi:predicted nucleic acid-binding protein